MKKFNLLSVLILLAFGISAQQTPVFSEYHNNPFVINTAYAGLLSKEITLSHSGSFNGIEGAPRTSVASFIGDTPKWPIGYGVGIVSEEIGVTKSNSVFGAANYKLKFHDRKHRRGWDLDFENALSMGLTFGVQMYRDNLLALDLSDDPNFEQNIKLNVPILGTAFMYTKANFFLGLSSPNLIGHLVSKESLVELQPQYFAYSGFGFYPDPHSKFMLRPSGLLKFQNGSPVQVDLNVTGILNDRFEGGIGYRTTSSINFFLGYYLNESFKLNYNYNRRFSQAPIHHLYGISLKYLLPAKK